MRLHLSLLTTLLVLAFASSAAASTSHIATVGDAASRRASITNYVYGQPHLPKTMPAASTGIRTAAFEDTPGLRSVDRLTHKMPGGFRSTMYLLHPERSNHRLLIFHSGHGTAFTSEQYRYMDNIRFFLARGYTILGVAMPMSELNPAPAWANAKLGHNAVSFMSHPLRPFLEPITVGLNYTLAKGSYRTVAMTGLSGGGWASSVYPAFDERVQRAYPVAGSQPLEYLKTNAPADFEQLALQSRARMQDLYAMGTTHGRRMLQIFNQHDPCCYWGTGFRKWAPPVSRVAEHFGGRYGVWLDRTNPEHSISEDAQRVIARDIASAR